MTRRFETLAAPYLVPRPSVPITMRRVLYALVPAAGVYVWFFGIGLIVNFLAATLVAVVLEALVLRRRAAEPRTTIGDGSAIVTAALLAFSLPPLVPIWIPALGAAVAILLGKHLYGGLGRNLFNPAMVGYVVLLISFPVEMTQWLPPRIGDLDYAYLNWLGSLEYALMGTLPSELTLDALTRATPLDQVKEGLRGMQTFAEVRSGALFGDFGGRGWEWIGNMIALGGVYLLYTRTISWRIPLAVLLGLIVPATIMYAIDPSLNAGPGFHLFSGATLLGAFFIATDPVTAATSDRGRLLFGAGIGALTYAIRAWGGYPDGMAFAILLMNAAAPLIDRYTQPRIYGH